MSANEASKQKEEIGPIADMAQEDLDEEASGEEPDFIFDEKKQYYPLFYLTEIPGDVRLSLRSKVPSL